MGLCRSKVGHAAEKTTPVSQIDVLANRHKRRLTEHQEEEIRSEYELNIVRRRRNIASPTMLNVSPCETSPTQTRPSRSPCDRTPKGTPIQVPSSLRSKRSEAASRISVQPEAAFRRNLQSPLHTQTRSSVYGTFSKKTRLSAVDIVVADPILEN